MTTTITVIGPSYIATRCDTSNGVLERRHFADLQDALEFSLTYRSVPAGQIVEYVAVESFSGDDEVPQSDRPARDFTQTEAEDYADECEEAAADFRSDR